MIDRAKTRYELELERELAARKTRQSFIRSLLALNVIQFGVIIWMLLL